MRYYPYPLRFYLSSKVFDLGQRPLTLRRGLASWYYICCCCCWYCQGLITTQHYQGEHISHTRSMNTGVCLAYSSPISEQRASHGGARVDKAGRPSETQHSRRSRNQQIILPLLLCILVLQRNHTT